MSDGQIIDLVREAVVMILLIAGPILILSVIVGLVIAIFQTVTSIQEQTLTFIPKLFVILGSLFFFSYYIISQLSDYTIDLFNVIPLLSR